MADDFDPYYTWLGIPKAEQPPNHYRLLGIALFEADDQVIAHAADRQMGYLRTFQTGPHSADSQTILNLLAVAKLCLLNATRRVAYDADLRAAIEAAKPKPPPPAEPLPAIPLRTPPRPGVLPPSLQRAAADAPAVDPIPGPIAREVPRRPPVWEREAKGPAPKRSSASRMPTLRPGITIQPPQQTDANDESADDYELAEPIVRFARRGDRDDEESAGESPIARLPKVILMAAVFVATAIGAAVMLAPSGEKAKTTGDTQNDAKAAASQGESKAPAPAQANAGGANPANGATQLAGGIVPPPTASAGAGGGNDRSINVLAALEQSRELTPGWHWDRGKLVNDASLDPHFLPLPLEIPQNQGQDSYLLEAVVERKAFDGTADGCLVFSLPGPDGIVDLLIDSGGQRTGVGFFDSAAGTRVVGTVMLGNLLPMGTPQSLVIRVSQKSVYVDCGGHRAEMDANSTRTGGLVNPAFSNPARKQARPTDRIAIGANQSFAFSKLELKPFNVGQFVQSSQLTQRQPPQTPDVGSASVNLLPLIKPERDTFSGEWRFEGGQLVSTGFARQWRTIEIPFRPPGNYKIVLRCTADSPQTAGVVMGLLSGGRQFTAGLDADGRLAGLTVMKPPDPRAIKLVTDSTGKLDADLSLEYVVGPQPWFTCNSRLAGTTNAQYSSVCIDPASVCPAPDRLFLSCRGSRFSVSQLEYQPLAVAPPPPRGFAIGGRGANPDPTAAAGGPPVPIAPGGIEVTADTPLAVGNRVNAEWRGQWWQAQVLDVLPDKSVQVHYIGFGSNFDEVVSRDRLRIPNANAAGNRVVAGANFANRFRQPPAVPNATPIVPSPILVAYETPLKYRDEIEVQSGTNWWKGHVTNVMQDGTVKVSEDDRNFEETVTRSRLRLPKQGHEAYDPKLSGVASLDARPVPSEDLIEDGLAKVKEKYKDAYAAAKTDDEKLKLSDRLLSEVASQSDDAQAFAMFAEARQLALDSGHWQQALQSVDLFDNRFQTGEPKRLQADVLLAASEKLESEESVQELVDAAISAVQEMLGGPTYSTSRDVALDFIKAANQAAHSPKFSDQARNKIFAQTTLLRRKITDRFAAVKGPTPLSPATTKSHKPVKSKR